MDQTSKKKFYIIFIIISVAILISYLKINTDYSSVSDVNWNKNDGVYLVSFKIKNETKSFVDAKLNIKLHQRKFAAGSPKAEILEIVGGESFNITLTALEEKIVNKKIKPDKFVSHLQMVTVNVLKVDKQ